MIAHGVLEGGFVFRNVNRKEADHESHYVGKHVCRIRQNSQRSRNYTTCELEPHEYEANKGDEEKLLHCSGTLVDLFLEFLIVLQRAFVDVSILYLFIERWLPGSVVMLYSLFLSRLGQFYFHMHINIT